jgi:hypothetical protein
MKLDGQNAVEDERWRLEKEMGWEWAIPILYCVCMGPPMGTIC